MKRHAVALFAVALAMPAAATPSAPAEKPRGAVTTSSQQEPQNEQVIVTPDAAVLMPAASKPWTPDDYEAAALILSRMPSDKLPDFDAPVFQRMIDSANMDMARDINTPMPQRLLWTQRYMLATAKIMACYLPDMKANPVRRESVAGLEGLFLHQLGLLMSQMHEIQSTPSPSMESSAMLDPKVDKIRNGLDNIIHNMVRSLNAPQARSQRAQAKLTQTLRDEYDSLAPYLSPETREATQNVLAQRAQR